MVSQTLPLKGAFQLNISTKKDTTEDKNIDISSLKKYFKNQSHTFWAHTNRSTMQQKLFYFF